MKRLLTICFSVLLVFQMRAAETVLVGNIYDAATGRPLPNVQLYFRGTQIGTTSSDSGFFFLRADVTAKVKLVVSLVGYKRQVFDVLPGQSAGLEIYLEEKHNRLGELLVLPDDQSALSLIEGVRDHKKTNDCAQALPASTAYFISDIHARHLRRKLWKGVENGLIMQPDSSYILPLPTEDYAQYMVPLPERFNFYDNLLPLLGTTLLSPLAQNAPTFYRYILMDSAIVAYGDRIEKHYRVHYIPKNTFNPTLEGVMTIDSASYALREVTARVPRDVSLNYVTDLRYSASYGPDGQLCSEQLQTLMEVAVKSDTSHLFPSLLACRRSLPQTHIPVPDTLLHLDSAYTAYISQRLPAPTITLPDDSLIETAQTLILEHPFYRVVRWFTTTCYTGYMPTGTAVDIGRIQELISINNVEQLHMGIPLRTNEKMHERFSLEGFIGWGIRDRGLKYSAGFSWLLPADRRQLLRVTAQDKYIHQDVSVFGALKNENGIGADNLRFTTRLFGGLTNKAFTYSTLGRQQQIQLLLESDWLASQGTTPSVETTLSVQFGRRSYGDAAAYQYYDAPTYQYASVRALLRLGWGEKMADLYMQRRHLYSRYPAVYIGAEMGSYRMPDAPSYAMYGLLNLMVRQDISLGMGGRLRYIVEGGVVLGRVPYPLLAIMSGNYGYTYSPDRFTLMSNYQYAADKYLAAHIEWDGRGILFNQIPGIRYARLHELVELKVAYGGLSHKHREVIDYTAFFGPHLMRSLSIPYTELGIGLGNIFRVADVYSVWRLTDRSNPYSARWGVRFCFDLSL